MRSNQKIVLVDDHDLQLALMQRLVSRYSDTIFAFQYVEEAIEHIKSSRTDIVFCDLQMPTCDGVDMLGMLHDINFSGKVVIASAMEPSIINAVLAMCRQYSFEVVGKLIKPCNDKDIVKLLSRVNKRNKSESTSQGQTRIGDSEFLLAMAEGRLINYYQPLIESKTNRVIGYEALVRLEHPEYGVISPGVFMPIVERLQLESELFDVVFDNVINDIKYKGLKHHVSINVEYSNLENESFASQFIKKCNQFEIPPSRFTVEITERDTYKNSHNLYKNLLKLRLNNVTVSIDDFGTGMSTLEKLAQFPFNELKIDRTFIQDIENDPKKHHIVHAICALAKSLKIKVVAEGIENKSLVDAVKDYSIDIYQGFYFNKPMSLSSVKFRSNYEN